MIYYFFFVKMFIFYYFFVKCVIIYYFFCKITFYSNKTTKESIADDYRFDYNYWNPWLIKFR